MPALWGSRRVGGAPSAQRAARTRGVRSAGALAGGRQTQPVEREGRSRACGMRTAGVGMWAWEGHSKHGEAARKRRREAGAAAAGARCRGKGPRQKGDAHWLLVKDGTVRRSKRHQPGCGQHPHPRVALWDVGWPDNLVPQQRRKVGK
eukprot:scaffold13636_cov112-Isochrysis_galbana.AAC.2